jgi:hypothetical protein
LQNKKKRGINLLKWHSKLTQTISKTSEITTKSDIPRYPKPKILLIDVDNRCAEVLRNAGYNVNIGTFGTPYKIKKSNELYYVPLSSTDLPNYEEQEIIIVNTLGPEPVTSLPTDIPSEGAEGFWQTGTDGVIDPRPLAMSNLQSAFDKILNYGGIFIIFASERYYRHYYYLVYRGYTWMRKSEINHSNWDFLTDLASIYTKKQCGYEIKFKSDEPKLRELIKILSQTQEKAEYHCTLSPSPFQKNSWISLAKNKYGEDVAGILFNENSKGRIIILPQMPDAHRFLVQLIEDWCSQWNPGLFPYLESNQWLHWSEYEIPKVVELRKEIERVKTEAEEKIKKIENEIKILQKEYADWYTLLNGTGDELVKAVVRSLKRLGFQKVVDVDDEIEREGKKEKREDIQILDQRPILIIEVKGIHGNPDDNESTQAEKHATMRMKEWGHTDVQPLTIINHQRHLPPRERNKKAFRDEIIEIAKEKGLGLMTTWDLFRILRNTELLNWPPEVVKPIFYRIGRIDPIPEHYEEIGEVAEVWKYAFGIIPRTFLSIGNRLAVEIDDVFIEFSIESLQIHGEPVQTAPAESECGIGFYDATKKIRKGMRVFLVNNVYDNLF